ncbi:MAG TPA: phage portal protein, partial [Clostridia bacterium]|nr:phage portal protein [Clostridia bacterium]
AQRSLDVSVSAEDYGAKFFRNGAIPSGILTTDKKIKDPVALRRAWQEGYGGGNTSRTAILEEGMRYERISLPNSDAQFLETRKFQVTEICRWYRVPPHMVGDLERATFANIEHQGIEFAVHTILPWVRRIEKGMNRRLLLPNEKGAYFVRANMDGLQRGDYKSRM